MSIASALRNRSALWHDVLDRFAYRPTASPPTTDPATLRIRAVRPLGDFEPRVAIDIFEVWVAGNDPDLDIKVDGCYPHAASWHAQVAPTGDVGADRLDLDRTKPRSLLLHRHPFGQSNEVRVPARALFIPARWMEHVEIVVYEQFRRSR